MGRGSAAEGDLPGAGTIAPFSAEGWALVTSGASREEVSAATGLNYDSIFGVREGAIGEAAYLACSTERELDEAIRDGWARKLLVQAFAPGSRRSRASKEGQLFVAWQRGIPEAELIEITGWSVKQIREIVEREAVEESESLRTYEFGE